MLMLMLILMLMLMLMLVLILMLMIMLMLMLMYLLLLSTSPLIIILPSDCPISSHKFGDMDEISIGQHLDFFLLAVNVDDHHYPHHYLHHDHLYRLR